MDDREEMRRLIDMIEKSAGSNTIEQAIDDLKTFANTASFLANKIDSRLKAGDVKKKKPAKLGKGKGLSKPAPPLCAKSFPCFWMIFTTPPPTVPRPAMPIRNGVVMG